MARRATPKGENPCNNSSGGYHGGGMLQGGGGGSGADVSQLPDYNPLKIFVGGVSHAIDEEAFKLHFSSFGEVIEAWLMFDPQTQQPRGFGFVIFAKREALDAVLAQSHHELAGKMVEVKRATPRSAQPPPSMPPNRGGGGSCGYGGMCGMMPPPHMMGYGGCGYGSMGGGMGGGMGG